MTEQIYGFFQTAEAAEHAIAALKDHGALGSEISVLHRADKAGAPDIEAAADRGLTSTTAGDVVSGAMKGGAAGLALGIVGGIVALTIPGVGLILAAGPLWAAIGASLAATTAGVVAGSTVGFLVDQGIPEAVASRYNEAMLRGDIIVSVRSAHLKDGDAVMLLTKYGATDVDSHVAQEWDSTIVEGATGVDLLSEDAAYSDELTRADAEYPIEPDRRVLESGPVAEWPAAPLHASEELLEPVGGGRV